MLTPDIFNDKPLCCSCVVILMHNCILNGSTKHGADNNGRLLLYWAMQSTLRQYLGWLIEEILLQLIHQRALEVTDVQRHTPHCIHNTFADALAVLHTDMSGPYQKVVANKYIDTSC